MEPGHAELSTGLAGSFTGIDWAIVAGYLLVTTVVGGLLAGKQASMRDFFLGGRKLPWYAVSASIIATEISAVTFISLPYVVYQPGGDFTYLQLGLFGAIIARVIVGFVLVPAYYRREIYSPYDYVGQKLGTEARSVTTVLFALGGILAQSARVYVTAIVLELVLRDSLFGWLADCTGLSPMTWSIWTIGVVAVGWTLMGGMATVIWTDAVLFLMFMGGALMALGFVVHALPGGVGEMIATGQAADKFRFFDFSPDPTRAYTFWTAIIANTWFCVGIYGTDQLLAQRMFCCRGPRQARLAILSSAAGQLVTVSIMLVGVGLYAYYKTHPLSGEALRLCQERGDRIFPIFILQVLPAGLTGMVIAAVFAAAISSLDSILAALSQTCVSAFYLPWRRRRMATTVDAEDPAEARRTVRVSRILVVIWGVVLCIAAQLAAVAAEYQESVLDLALTMAGYASGALLAGFLLAFLPLKVDGRGLCWSGPISVFTVFAVAWHQPWARAMCWGFAVAVLALWVAIELRANLRGNLFRTAAIVLALAVMLTISHYGYWPGPADQDGHPTYHIVAFPWFAPIGCTVALVLGYLLGHPKNRFRHAADTLRMD